MTILQTERAILADLHSDDTEITQIEERQYLKQLDDILDETISSLDHLIGTIQKVHDNIIIVGLNMVDSFALSNHQIISHTCQENVENLRHCRAQARALQSKVKSACDLVK